MPWANTQTTTMKSSRLSGISQVVSRKKRDDAAHPRRNINCHGKLLALPFGLFLQDFLDPALQRQTEFLTFLVREGNVCLKYHFLLLSWEASSPEEGSAGDKRP